MSEMFNAAHVGAKADRAFDKSHSYAYYFRLHLLVLQSHAREARIGVCYAFQIVEPKRVWA